MAAKKQSGNNPNSGIWKESTKSLSGPKLKSSAQDGTMKSPGSLTQAALSAERPNRPKANTGSENDFWSLVIETARTSEQERIARISQGYPANHLVTIRSALTLTASLAEQLFSVSQSTLLRRLKGRQRLSSVTSERLDRLASVANLAHEVFEDRDRALSWLSTPNVVLGNQQPVMLCETEIGANQVRRILHALEWGGVA
jgi:putative toxin-antitoxin system antitoxin component (TIGR02293 family)